MSTLPRHVLATWCDLLKKGRIIKRARRWKCKCTLWYFSASFSTKPSPHCFFFYFAHLIQAFWLANKVSGAEHLKVWLLLFQRSWGPLMVLEKKKKNHRSRFCFLAQKLGSANTGWRASANWDPSGFPCWNNLNSWFLATFMVLIVRLFIFCLLSKVQRSKKPCLPQV